MRFFARKCLLLTRSIKKKASGNYFQRNACQPGRTPYNAPPLTRHNGLRNAVFRRLGKLSRRMKYLKKGVDSEGE
ncbi:hypothetical protein A6J33_006705 [Pantoea sp. FDAARGOS_194]|nr:hypothetical protein A6J33_006705 [Pantoea sp. FDAARGOS_194]